MLKVELRSLEQEDLLVEEKGWAQSLGIELVPELNAEPLEIHCVLSKIDDLISAKGWVKGKMLLCCDRCLKSFESCYKSYFEMHYRPQPTDVPDEGMEEDLPDGTVETVYYEGDILDIADQVRQTVLLSVPMRALCSDGCRGLCGGCGCDLNLESCRCSGSNLDPRWSALKDWKSS
jgi:uncharacterized protein